MLLRTIPLPHLVAAGITGLVGLIVAVVLSVSGHGTPTVLSAVLGGTATTVLQALNLGSSTTTRAAVNDVGHQLQNGTLQGAIMRALNTPLDLELPAPAEPPAAEVK
jgi:hypothetical protein